jgi:hypothetical protein
MKFEQGMAQTLKGTEWVITRKGFAGFSQDFYFHCTPSDTPNSCMIKLTVPSPNLKDGQVVLNKRKHKCRGCPVEKWASKLSLDVTVEDDTPKS